jgi:cytochrome c oxidase subunit 2
MVVLNMTRKSRTAALLLAVALLPGWPAKRAAALPQGEAVEINAERFAFTPSEVRVRAGVPLKITLSSEDTDHGFQIPGTEIDVRIPKRNRGTVTVTFVGERPGRHVFQCSHVCGAGHSFMRGSIVVTE